MMFLLATVVSATRLERMIDRLLEQGASLGLTLIKAFLIFLIGRYLIKLINKIIKRILSRRDIEMSVKTFVGSLVNVVLTILLIISVVNKAEYGWVTDTCVLSFTKSPDG